MGAASRVVVAVTGAATTILVARLLGADGAGGFALALTIVYVLSVLTTLGMEHGIVYFVSVGRWGARAAFATSQRLAVLIGLAGAALGILARLTLPTAFGGLSVAECAAVAGVLPFAVAWFYGSFVALADDHYEGYVLPPAVQSATLLVLAVALTIPFGLTGAIVALAASHVLTGVATFVWGRRRIGGRGSAPPTEPGQLRRALSFGFKGYAANALQVLNYRVDLFLLSSVASTAVVGRYSVAVAITTVLWLLPQALSDVLFPRVAALSASEDRDSEAHRALVEAKSLRHATLVVAVSTAGLALVLLLLVVPVYGPDFADSVALGLIRLPGVALIGLSGVLSASVIGRGHPQYGLYAALIVTPVTLALYVVLIPTYEATGAALASSISFAVSFGLIATFYRRATGHGVLPLLLPGRAEIEDYRTLWPKVREWASGLRGRAG